MTPSTGSADHTVLSNHPQTPPIGLPLEVPGDAYQRPVRQSPVGTSGVSEGHDGYHGERLTVTGECLGDLEHHGSATATHPTGDTGERHIDQAGITQCVAHRDRKRCRRNAKTTAIWVPVGLGQLERNLIELIHFDHQGFCSGWPPLGGELDLDDASRRVRTRYQDGPTCRRGCWR